MIKKLFFKTTCRPNLLLLYFLGIYYIHLKVVLQRLKLEKIIKKYNIEYKITKLFLDFHIVYL